VNTDYSEFLVELHPLSTQIEDAARKGDLVRAAALCDQLVAQARLTRAALLVQAE
jgi:hypothetical protein